MLTGHFSTRIGQESDAQMAMYSVGFIAGKCFLEISS